MSKELMNIIKQIGIDAFEETSPMGILFGVVESITPLIISVEQRLKITEEFLILTSSVMDYKTQISFDNNKKYRVTNWDDGENEQSNYYKLEFKENKKEDITVYNRLDVGESVILLRIQGGQKFIVLERLVI